MHHPSQLLLLPLSNSQSCYLLPRRFGGAFLYFAEIHQCREIKLGLSIIGSRLNADAIFDTRDARKVCFNHKIMPNIAEDKRKITKRSRKRLVQSQGYKQRFAWIDKFRALLIRFERKTIYLLGDQYLAFALINLRHRLA
jgi:hypothetical protein